MLLLKDRQPELRFSEKKLREKLRIPRDQFRRIRTSELKLKKGADFETLLADGAIALSERGLGRLLEWLRATQPDIQLPADFNDCLIDVAGKKETAQTASVEMAVVRLFPNRRLLKCRFVDPALADREAVQVRVPDNRNFVPKMKLQARLSDGGIWQLVGRVPARKGRWPVGRSSR